MDPKLLELADSIDKLNICQRKNCRDLKKRRDALMLAAYAKHANLLQHVYSGKISAKAFEKLSIDLAIKLERSIECTDLMRCSLEKCREDVNANIDALQKLFAQTCEKTKKCCNINKKTATKKEEDVLNHWTDMNVKLHTRCRAK